MLISVLLVALAPTHVLHGACGAVPSVATHGLAVSAAARPFESETRYVGLVGKSECGGCAS